MRSSWRKEGEGGTRGGRRSRWQGGGEEGRGESAVEEEDEAAAAVDGEKIEESRRKMIQSSFLSTREHT